MFGKKKNRTIYHYASDYKCPLCNHVVAQHRNANLLVEKGCTICQCEMSQSKLWKLAQEWKYEPPENNVLLEFMNLPKEDN